MDEADSKIFSKSWAPSSAAIEDPKMDNKTLATLNPSALMVLDGEASKAQAMAS